MKRVAGKSAAAFCITEEQNPTLVAPVWGFYFSLTAFSLTGFQLTGS
jgi:hypothetical protein